ncbi:MAG TPA: hypothetical protein PLX89_04180 [Verrucomicrobiota bacterium]|nr:hypothetical protein [Verrucomicrobiales bacterium]HRI12182.1 hypothetical protein [Verrucomicrobiota bacterium]
MSVVPALEISLTDDGQAQLTWSLVDAGYVLESAVQLDSQAGWLPVSPAPITNSYTVLVDQSVRFFRLRKP